MADQKITDLTALTGANAASTDLAVLVDVSDTTMAATGTNKKITLAELRIALAALGIAVIDSAYDAKGDIIAGTAADTAARLAVGINGQVLTAASGQATGLQWATPTTGEVVTTAAVWDAKGDLVVGTGADTAQKLTVGTNTYAPEAASGETTGIKWSTVYSRPQEVNAQTGTTYTLVAGDFGKLVTLSNAGAITLTVPQDSDATIAIGTYVDLYQLGAGQVTVAAGTGATLRVSGLTAKARAQYSRLAVQKVSANTWSLMGDLAAS